MTSKMNLFIDENLYFPYEKGIPQGSCISPMLFNLYYEKALETISPYSDFLLVFADDLAVLKKDIKNMPNIIFQLKNWGKDFNLFVNDKKTEIMLINTQKPIYVQYKTCSNYKYLGAMISNNRNDLNKNIIYLKIRNFTRKLKWQNIRNINCKATKFTVIWWLLSKLLYEFITDVYLDYISIEELEQRLIISIKTVLGIKKGVKQSFIKG